MKALREGVSINQSIHNLGAVRASGQRHPPTALLWNPLYRSLGGSRRR